MAASNIDEIDRQILAELQDDGRMTNVELAKKVGLTAPPCLRRVRSLEDSGAIKRSEEHTSELQSLMRISYAVFCLKKKTLKLQTITTITFSHTKPNHTNTDNED